MNKSKRSFRTTLEALTAVLTDAILAAARESIQELVSSRPAAPAAAGRAPTRRERARAVPSAPPKKPRVVRARPARTAGQETAPAPEAASDLLITDPQALLAAIATASPASSSEAPHDLRQEHAREEPEILAPVARPAAEPAFVLALRAGEEIMRTSGSGVVLRRRRS